MNGTHGPVKHMNYLLLSPGAAAVILVAQICRHEGREASVRKSL